MKRLEVLDIAETSIGDAGLKQIGGVPRLRRLYLSGSRVTQGGVAEFRREHPQCEVSWE
jgi:hypothetical protein